MDEGPTTAPTAPLPDDERLLLRASSPDPNGPAPLGLAPGARIDRYTVLGRLGVGGSGEVYAAYDGKLDRKVALKVLLHGGSAYEARLEREAKAMARLSHPNVVGVFDTGMVGDRLFLAMEFVQGQTLRVWRREAPRSVDEILRVYSEAGRGLAAAHAAGLVHRDFKPENVLISTDGHVKVTDFGVVRAADEQVLDPELRGLVEKLGAQTGPTSGPRRSSVPPRSAATKLVEEVESHASLATTSSLSISQPVTEMGTMIGTPGYMAPEQYLCADIDARTDQFSFCASLYEALYEQKPFAGKGMMELAETTVLGEVRLPPRGTAVPARIHRVLLRGLANDGAERYPTMRALLDDLVRDPAKRWRRAAAWASGAAAVLGLLIWTQRVATARQGRLCSGSPALASEVWNDPTRQSIERSLLATGVPYASDTWKRTLAQLDGYMDRWTVAHKQTCEATRLDGSQSESVMTLRMACLDQRRQAVSALAQVLENADRDVVAKAHQASLELPDLDACKNVTSLSGALPEPADPDKHGELAAVRTELSSLRAKVEAGKFKDAAAQAGPLVERAQKMGYAPTMAEVLLWSGSAKIESGAPRDEALAQWKEAAFQADVGRDDAVRAQAATLLMRRVPAAGRFTEAEQWSKVADAALQRAGDIGLGRARYLEALGWLFDAEGLYKDAVDYRTQAFELARRVGTDPRLAADIERGLAAERARLGEVDEPKRLIAEADEAIVRVLGDKHPGRIPFLHARAFVAGASVPRDGAKYENEAIVLALEVAPNNSLIPTMYNNVCSYDEAFGAYEDARAACERSIALARAVWGEEASILPNAYAGLGQTLNDLHRYDEAMQSFQQAIARQEKLGTQRNTNYVSALGGLGIAELGAGRARDAIDPLERAVKLAPSLEDKAVDTQRTVAQARFGLARALWVTGTRTPRVSELATSAEATFRAIDNGDAAQEVARWRAANQVP